MFAVKDSSKPQKAPPLLTRLLPFVCEKAHFPLAVSLLKGRGEEGALLSWSPVTESFWFRGSRISGEMVVCTNHSPPCTTHLRCHVSKLLGQTFLHSGLWAAPVRFIDCKHSGAKHMGVPWFHSWDLQRLGDSLWGRYKEGWLGHSVPGMIPLLLRHKDQEEVPAFYSWKATSSCVGKEPGIMLESGQSLDMVSKNSNCQQHGSWRLQESVESGNGTHT